MKLLYPVAKASVVTQSYDDHVQRARQNGWCFAPAVGCKTYYYGGIDWGVPAGTPVLAAQSGVVTIARRDTTGYGTHVRIRHSGGYETIYGHLSELLSRVGNKVVAGDVIGRSGSTGFSTGPHLHFECRIDGVPIDPAPMLVDEIDGENSDSGNGETTEFDLPEFPQLPRAIVVVERLNIRSDAGIKEKIVAQLQEGVDVEVIRAVRVGNDVWLQIGNHQWVAGLYNGEKYIEFKGAER